MNALSEKKLEKEKIILPENIKQKIYNFSLNNSFEKLLVQQRESLEKPVEFQRISTQTNIDLNFIDSLLEKNESEIDPELFLLDIAVYFIKNNWNHEILRSKEYNEYILAVVEEILKGRNKDECTIQAQLYSLQEKILPMEGQHSKVKKDGIKRIFSLFL